MRVCNENDLKYLVQDETDKTVKQFKEQISSFICIDDPSQVSFEKFKDGAQRSLYVGITDCRNKTTDCRTEKEIETYKQSLFFYEIVYNQNEYQPNGFGQEMVKRSAQSRYIYGVQNNVNFFDLKLYKATSEEEVLGLGLGQENYKEFFAFDFESSKAH